MQNQPVRPAKPNGARIELDQSEPHVGDRVTFTVSTKTDRRIRLVCDPKAAYWPPEENTLLDITQTADTTFILDTGVPTTGVAWLLGKDNETPVVGTLFWIDA